MPDKLSISDIKNEIRIALKKGFEKDEIAALIKILFEDLLGINAVELAISGDKLLHSAQAELLLNAVNRLKNNEPIQYVTQKAYCFGRTFNVNTSVLIPRPETEELMASIIEKNKSKQRELTILDIGTGSGCIAITLQKELSAKVFAADISVAALETASENAVKNSAEVTFVELDILNYNNQFKNQKFDIIVSNPPYVLESEQAQMQPNVLDFEPHIALFVKDNNALIFYEKITALGKDKLNPGGQLYFEINEAKAKAVAKLLENNQFKMVKINEDIFGKERFVWGTV